MISLEKRTEDAHASLINLLKTEQSRGIDLGDLTAQVELVVDYSGSMKKRLRSHRGRPSEVQTVVERALALALSGLDDDGIVPVRFFQDFVFDPVLIDRDNYEGFVERQVDEPRRSWIAQNSSSMSSPHDVDAVVKMPVNPHSNRMCIDDMRQVRSRIACRPGVPHLIGETVRMRRMV